MVCSSAVRRKTPVHASGDETGASSPLEMAIGAGEWEGRLLLPCGRLGLFVGAISGLEEPQPEAGLRPVIGLDLTEVIDVRMHPHDPARGVLAIGSGPDNRVDYEWVPAAKLAV